MKKVMFAIAAVIMFAACNNSGNGSTTVDSTAVDSVKVDTTAVAVDTTASAPAVETK